MQLYFSEVVFVEGMKDYVKFHTVNGTHLAYKRMKDLENVLPSQFLRIHNSYIINSAFIRKVEDNEIIVRDQALPLSEKYRERFLADEKKSHARPISVDKNCSVVYRYVFNAIIGL